MASIARKRTETHLTRREFFHDVAETVQLRLPAELGRAHVNTTHNLLKIYFGYHRLHFEVWTNARDNHIEIGLHFEDGPESTERILRYFNGHIVELKHELGAEIELERWTLSWGHLYQHIAYQPLTEQLVEQVGERLARMIVCIQPLLCEADPRARGR